MSVEGSSFFVYLVLARRLPVFGSFLGKSHNSKVAVRFQVELIKYSRADFFGHSMVRGNMLFVAANDKGKFVGSAGRRLISFSSSTMGEFLLLDSSKNRKDRSPRVTAAPPLLLSNASCVVETQRKLRVLRMERWAL